MSLRLHFKHLRFSCRPWQSEVPVHSLSVIIPTLNEADQISQSLAALPRTPEIEILVTDGGSSDGTQELVRAAGLDAIQAPSCRAVQMNLAAEQARGEVLLFLHADTILPVGFQSWIEQALAHPDVVLGAFELAIAGPGAGLRGIERFANWRSRLLSKPYGDQALFLRWETFFELGGFRPIPIMEDYELVLRAGRLGKVKIMSAAVQTSARRWRRMGIVRTTLMNWIMVAGFHLGVSPARLARWYRG